jgi:hypothetical protein
MACGPEDSHRAQREVLDWAGGFPCIVRSGEYLEKDDLEQRLAGRP